MNSKFVTFVALVVIAFHKELLPVNCDCVRFGLVLLKLRVIYGFVSCCKLVFQNLNFMCCKSEKTLVGFFQVLIHTLVTYVANKFSHTTLLVQVLRKHVKLNFIITSGTRNCLLLTNVFSVFYKVIIHELFWAVLALYYKRLYKNFKCRRNKHLFTHKFTVWAFSLNYHAVKTFGAVNFVAHLAWFSGQSCHT